MSDKDNLQKTEQSQTVLSQILHVLGVVFVVIVAITKWLFMITMFILGTIFWLIDLWLGDGRNPVEPPWDRRRQRNQLDQNKFRRDIQNATVEDILKQFNEKFEQIEKRNELETEEKKVIRKIKGLDRSKLRSQMKDSLSKEELEILFLLLLKILSGELG